MKWRRLLPSWSGIVATAIVLAVRGCGDEVAQPEPVLDAEEDCIPTWSCEEYECGVHPSGCGDREIDCGPCRGR